MQQYPVYLLWNRRKTLTGSPDPTRAYGTNRPCNSLDLLDNTGINKSHDKGNLYEVFLSTVLTVRVEEKIITHYPLKYFEAPN